MAGTAADKRIPDLPLKGVLLPGMKVAVYDPATDTTYQMEVSRVAGPTTLPAWSPNVNYAPGQDVKVYDAAGKVWTPFTRTAAALPGVAPFIKPGEDIAKTYYEPWAGSGGGEDANRVHSAVFSKHFN